jgi:hypothetical protein
VTDQSETLGRTVWFFVADDDDRVWRFPLKRWNRFHGGREPVAEFVGRTTVRMIEIGLLLRDRRPVDVFHVHSGLVPIDRAGRLDEVRYHTQMSEAVNNMWAPGAFDRRALPPSVLDARERFDERLLEHRRAQYDGKYKWKPSDAVWGQVRQAIWGSELSPRPPSRRTAGDSAMAKKRNKQKRHQAFTAVLFQGNLVEDRIGRQTEVLTSRFGLPVLAVASVNTDGGGGGEGSGPETYGAPKAQEAAQQAAYDLYRMANHDIPPVKSEAELNAWVTKRAQALRKLADGLQKGTTARKRAALRNRAERIRAAAERLVLSVDNWELEDEDKRWQAKQAEKVKVKTNQDSD